MRKIADIKKKIVIPAVDINSAKEYIFTNGKSTQERYISDIPVGTAIRASSSLPRIFLSMRF